MEKLAMDFQSLQESRNKMLNAYDAFEKTASSAEVEPGQALAETAGLGLGAGAVGLNAAHQVGKDQAARATLANLGHDMHPDIMEAITKGGYKTGMKEALLEPWKHEQMMRKVPIALLAGAGGSVLGGVGYQLAKGNLALGDGYADSVEE